MARKLRAERNGGLYHVINRGNYRSYIFESEGAKRSFEKTLFEACERFSWELAAYCLMSNHFHLCIGTPLGNLSNGMRWLQATYAMRFNKYRKARGHLFQGRFKSLVVEPGQHWLDLVDYIHLNPVKAGLADLAMLGKFPWTSLYLFPKRKKRPSFMDCAWMDYSEELEDSKDGWSRYLAHLHLRSTDDPTEIEALERRMCYGWSLGSSDFAKAVIEDLDSRPNSVRLEREELSNLNRDRWQVLIEKCLDRLGKSLDDARSERFSTDWKLAIASKLKRETSVTNAWLSEQLEMGKPRSVSAICGKYSREREKSCEFAQQLNQERKRQNNLDRRQGS